MYTYTEHVHLNMLQCVQCFSDAALYLEYLGDVKRNVYLEYLGDVERNVYLEYLGDVERNVLEQQSVWSELLALTRAQVNVAELHQVFQLLHGRLRVDRIYSSTATCN